MNEFSRHDMPETVKNLIKVAVETRSYDLIEVYAAAVNFGSDWQTLTEDICNTAFANRHAAGDGHGLVVKAAELVYAVLVPK